MRLIFLGTGGGRTVTRLQARNTGGFFIEINDEESVYIDPGPGAIVHANRLKLKLYKLKCLFVSHAHIDHSNDANMIIEAMTLGMNKKRGTVVGSKSVVEGYESIEKVLTEYHKSGVENVLAVEKGDVINFESFSLRITEAKHTDPTCVGFIMEVNDEKNNEKLRMGYSADTVFFREIAEQYKNCDLLILNCLYDVNKYKGMDVAYAKHMDKDDAVEFLAIAKPKECIIQHYGMGIVKIGPEKIAREIEERSGIKVHAVRDYDEFLISEDKIVKNENKQLNLANFGRLA